MSVISVVLHALQGMTGLILTVTLGVCFKDGGRDFVCATTPYKSLQTISQNLGINDPDSLSALKFARFLQSKIIIPFLVGAGPILVVGFLCFVFMKALHLHDQFLDRKGRYSNSKRGYLKYFRNVAKICLYTSVAIGVVAATSTAMAVAALTLGGQVANGPDFKAGELLVGLEIAGVSANFVFFLLALDIILEDTTVYEMTEDEFEEYTRPRERYRGR